MPFRRRGASPAPARRRPASRPAQSPRASRPRPRRSLGRNRRALLLCEPAFDAARKRATASSGSHAPETANDEHRHRSAFGTSAWCSNTGATMT